MDMCEGFCEDDVSVEVVRLEGGVFMGGIFIVVVFCDDELFVVGVFLFLGEFRDGVFVVVEVVGGVNFVGFSVDGGLEGVCVDVGEVVFVFELGVGSGDGVCCVFVGNFDEDVEVGEVGGGEWREGVEEGEVGGGGGDGDGDGGVGGLGDDVESRVVGFEGC